MNQYFFQILSSSISGMALVWGIYSYVIKSREAAAEKDRTDFSLSVHRTRDILEKELGSLRTKLEIQSEELMKLKLSVLESNSRIITHGSLIENNLARLEKVIERHDAKLDIFGKVIVKDK